MTLDKQTLLERTAQIAAHRACCGTEHDPANGKLHGYCIVCGIPWPCEYAGKPLAAQQPENSREAVLEELVNRFLAWPLPESVCSDLCATQRGYPHRSGTTLLTADEARKMLEYVLKNNAGGQELPAVTSASRQESTTERTASTEPVRDSAQQPVPPAPDAAAMPENAMEDYEASIYQSAPDTAPREPTQHTANPVSDSPTPAEAAPIRICICQNCGLQHRFAEAAATSNVELAAQLREIGRASWRG